MTRRDHVEAANWLLIEVAEADATRRGSSRAVVRIVGEPSPAEPWRAPRRSRVLAVVICAAVFSLTLCRWR